MNINKLAGMITILLLYPNLVFGGYSPQDSGSHRLKYEINGELMVKPNRAVYPIGITVASKSFEESLKKIKTINKSLEGGVANLGAEVFSVTPSGLFKPRESRKKLDLSFFGSEKSKYKVKLVTYLTVNFTDSIEFWNRAERISKALDFIEHFSDKYSTENILITYDNVAYEISDVEKYRKPLTELIYRKAKSAAKIIADEEKTKITVKYVSFGQSIKEVFVNFSEAYLSINAEIEYGLE